jgi:WD40 repeat protein
VLLGSITAGEPSSWLPGKSAVGECFAFSTDGAWLAKASPDQSVPIWNLHTGRLERRYSGHLDEVRTVAFSPDGQWLVSGGRDRSVRIWSAAPPKPATILSNIWPPYVLSPDGAWLAARIETVPGKAYEPCLWNLETLEAAVLVQPAGEFLPLGFSADSKSFVARGRRSGSPCWHGT